MFQGKNNEPEIREIGKIANPWPALSGGTSPWGPAGSRAEADDNPYSPRFVSHRIPVSLLLTHSLTETCPEPPSGRGLVFLCREDRGVGRAQNFAGGQREEVAAAVVGGGLFPAIPPHHSAGD